MRKANPGQQSPDAMSSPEARLLAGMRERYAQWQKQNPTPAQQLKRTLDDKSNLVETDELQGRRGDYSGTKV